ncbi:hypothetical protein [Paraburkholderia sp. DGU8]
MLKLTIPRREEAKPRPIEVSAGWLRIRDAVPEGRTGEKAFS